MNILGTYFANPWFLLGLLALPIYLYYTLAKKNEESSFTLGLSHFDKGYKHMDWQSILFKFMPILKGLAYAAFIIAMAKPQDSFEKQKINSEGIDIVCAIDLSMSMLAKDFEPDRLTVAKEVIKEFINDRKGDRIGLTAFAGESYTACPPTLDRQVILNFIDGLQYGQIKDGTAIGMGISSSVNRLIDSKAKSKIIILLTDGENNSGVVEPLDAATMAKELGIKIYTIGVGTNGEALMPYPTFSGYRYRRVPVRIDESLLTEISSLTDGAYFRATNKEELEEIYNHINELEKSNFDSTVITNREDKFHPYAISGLLLLALYYGLGWSLFRNINLT